MIGDTLTVTYDGVAVVLVRVNQDNYSSEYLKQVGTVEHRVKIAHNRENAKNNVLMERHRVEYVRTDTDPVTGISKSFSSISVIRAPDRADRTVIEKTAQAQTGLMTVSLIGKLVGWES